MNLSDGRLIDMHISALFLSDAQGRLRYIREPGYDESELDPAPRFFLGRTLHGNVWRFRQDVPPQLVRAIDKICLDEPIAGDLTGPPRLAEAIRTALNEDVPMLSKVNHWLSL